MMSFVHSYFNKGALGLGERTQRLVAVMQINVNMELIKPNLKSDKLHIYVKRYKMREINNI